MYVSSQSPFYDDFNETKKFYRILFRPGRAVQARELTQLQSILQKQIERFGSHIFKEGSIVIPGSQYYETNYNFVKLQATYNSIDADNVIDDLIGEIIVGQTNNVRARVVKVVTSEGADPPTIYVKYLNSGSNGVTYVFEDNEILQQETGGSPIIIRAASANATGVGSAFSIKSGVIFVKGVFAYFEDSTFIVSKYSKQTSDKRIGFLITEEVIDDQDDSSLLDPAVGTANYFAPGAERYKLDLTLEARGLFFDSAVDDTNFVELIRLQNNEIVFQKPKVEYNILADELARRTYDESGDYSVIPHKIDLLEHLRSSNNRLDGYLTSSQGGDDNKYVVKVMPGKSYIKGYEIETLTNKYIIGNKARNFANVNAGTISVEVGNFVNVTDAHSSPDVLTLSKVKLYNKFVTTKGAAPTNAVLVGNARVRSFEYSSGTVANSTTGVYSLYLFDVSMVTGYKFENDVKSFYYDNAGFEDFTANIVPTRVSITGSATTTNSSNVITGSGTLFNSELSANSYVSIGNQLFQVASISNNISFMATTVANSNVSGETIYLNKATISSNDKQSYVFETPYKFIKTIDPDKTETTYTARRIVDTNLSSGNITLTAKTNETFSPYSIDNYKILIKQYGRYEDLTGKVSRGGTPTGRTVTITLGANTNITTDAVRIFATVNKTNSAAIEKNKTLQTNSTIDYTDANTAAAAIVSLGKADVYRLVSVSMSSTAFGTSYSSTNATDITNRYSFDNGQRLQFYDVGRIILKPNQAKPTGPIRITFDYFTHSTTGDYFSVDSYTDIAYKDIPSINLNGKLYNLRDCVDFRPRIGDDSTFSATSAIINEFLDQETDFQTDYQYYLPKTDKLVLDRSGNIFIVSGVSSNNPKEPSTPDNAMALYVFRQEPYVRNVDVDVNVTEIDNRRFTMRDIGRIESRVKNLEYYTSLNLLETQTATLQIQDSLGFDRFKNGFVVDNFSGHGIGDVSNPDYKISIDYNKKEIRPLVNQIFKSLYEVNLYGSPDTSTNRSANNYSILNKLILPKYTHEALISSTSATKTEFVNPYNITTFRGILTLNPSSDSWHDELLLPILNENNNGNYDSLTSISQIQRKYETIYGNWRDIWYGNERTSDKDIGDGSLRKTSTIRTSDLILNSTGNRYEIMETMDTTVSDEKVISRVVIPIMRNKEISFVLKGMKPNTRLYAFFDDINVTNFTCISYQRANVIATLTGETADEVIRNRNLITDQYGDLEGVFSYSASQFKISAGIKKFRFTDSVNNGTDQTTFAEAVFSSNGQLTFKEKIISTQPVNVNTASSNPNTSGSYPPSTVGPLGITSVTPGGEVIKPVTNYGLLVAGGPSIGAYNTEKNQDLFAEKLEEQGFVVADIVNLTSDVGLAGSYNAADAFPTGTNQFDYKEFFDEASTSTGAICSAITSAGAAGEKVVDHFTAAYETAKSMIGDAAYAISAWNCVSDAITNNPGFTVDQLADKYGFPTWKGNPFVEAVYSVETDPALKAATGLNDQYHNTGDYKLHLSASLVAGKMTLGTIRGQDNDFILNSINGD